MEFRNKWHINILSYAEPVCVYMCMLCILKDDNLCLWIVFPQINMVELHEAEILLTSLFLFIMLFIKQIFESANPYSLGFMKLS